RRALVDLGWLLDRRDRPARRAGRLLVEAEVVLGGDGGQRLLLRLDRQALLGLDRLVQAVGPPPPRHGPARELVDDDRLAVADEVVRVTVEQRRRLERRVDLVRLAHVL